MKENKKDELISLNAGTSSMDGDESSFSELKTPPTTTNPQYITPTQIGGAQQKKPVKNEESVVDVKPFSISTPNL